MVEDNVTNFDKIVNDKICFVIMPFSDPEGYEDGHFRKIYEQIFKPAIEDAGYTPFRMDENCESTLIQAKIYNYLINAPMVLCDLSSKNPNVLYELGIRHAYDKPVVLVQEQGQSHIFDIAGLTTVSYRKNRMYDEVIQDQQSISEAIKQTANVKNNYSVMSLVSLSPATPNIKNNITREERIEYLLADLNRKMNRLEEHVFSIDSGCDGETARYSAERRLKMLVESASNMLRRAESLGELPTESYKKLLAYRLKNAIRDCLRADVALQHLEEAEDILLKLQNPDGEFDKML